MLEKGTLYKRRVVTVFNVLEDIGGMEEAICLVLAPFVTSIAARSFNYDLVTKHMKVKKRSGKKTKIPTDPVDEKLANSIFDLAGITSIDSLGRGACAMICLPFSCHRKGHSKAIATLLKRGSEQYESATDVLSMVRMEHRIHLIESLFFNRG